ncbi:hypothetical protein GETHLI_27800 [Geothrix limicola]|uniref:Polysaccharide biosynthesis protein n=2 Tax=Geothrix limicola TaxID=2927978 RepID=A0ABQ5QIX5_9BACT|nr:hypothetical protein GETHLI_27800 [Geothrix limicola]
MRKLALIDLGQVALAQTMIMFISLFQLGIINGGYRLYSSQNLEENRKINNLISSFIFVIAIVFGTICLGLLGLIKSINFYFSTITISLIAGLATLGSNWYTNCLVADGRLRISNLINLLAAMSSLAIAASLWGRNLNVALLSLVAQPVLAMILTLIIYPVSRPTQFLLSSELLRRILSLGFIPFAGGILAILTVQIERWMIIYALGPEQLGHYYIIILYTSVFTLVPASLLNVYYPTAMRRFETEDFLALSSIMKQHAKDLIRYIALAVLMTVFLIKPVVTMFLSKFKADTGLVFLGLPGFMAVAMCDVFSLHYHATRRLGPLLWQGLVGIFSLTGGLWILVATKQFSLEHVVIVKSVAAMLTTGMIAALYFRERHERRSQA